MKVSELIKKLEKLNQNTEFVIKGGVYEEDMVELILFIDLEKTTVEEVDLYLMSSLVEE
jgi:uncharacterized protein YigE (DUF2233 family)